MKRLFLIAAMMFSFAVSGCDKDIRRAPTKVQAAFEAMFPDATNIEWEKEMGLYKTEFHSGNHEKEAWFEKDGTWKRTKTDIQMNEVPDAVLQAAKNYKDSSWRIDDIDYFEQSSGVTEFYRIEFDKDNSEKERIIHIRPDGTIITDF